MKYKVNDRVKIVTGEHSKVWHPCMEHLEGRKLTISAVSDLYDGYGELYLLANGYFIQDDDIEGLAE